MSDKTKNNKKLSKQIKAAAGQAGILMMAAAATIGMVELPDNMRSRVAVPNQPVFAFANNLEQQEQGNNLRREREDTAPHYISYSDVQRTPSRSGRF
jgi:hypothetical protein